MFKAGSYNILSQTCDRKYKNPAHHWSKRLPYVAKLIDMTDVDIVGLQEATQLMIEQLMVLLSPQGWECSSVPILSGSGKDPIKKESTETCTIIWRASIIVAEDGDPPTLELFPNTNDATAVRGMGWKIFTLRSNGFRFLFSTCHYDHVGVDARRQSAIKEATLIKDLTKTFEGLDHFVAVGDRNWFPPHFDHIKEKVKMIVALNSKNPLCGPTVRGQPETTWLGFVDDEGRVPSYSPDRPSSRPVCRRLDIIFSSMYTHSLQHLPGQYDPTTLTTPGAEKAISFLPAHQFRLPDGWSNSTPTSDLFCASDHCFVVVTLSVDKPSALIADSNQK